MALRINWFKIELTPSKFSLPTKFFDAWQDSTAALENEAMKPFDRYRGRFGGERIGIVLLNGPERPSDWEPKDYDGVSTFHVVAEIIERGLQNHFRQQGFFTNHSPWGLTATRPVDEVSNIGIRLSCGVSCKVHSPSSEAGLGVVIQWEVKTEFSRSLADEEMRSMSIGLPVVLRYDSRLWQPEQEIKRFRNRYFGIVRRVDANTIEVIGRDNLMRKVPADKLFIEAKPSAIREFERRNPGKEEPRSVWRRIQQLNHVLTEEGRRNTSVLQDRLRAIRRCLSPKGSDILIVDLPIFEGGQMNLDLKPAVVSEEAAS